MFYMDNHDLLRHGTAYFTFTWEVALVNLLHILIPIYNALNVQITLVEFSCHELEGIRTLEIKLDGYLSKEKSRLLGMVTFSPDDSMTDLMSRNRDIGD